MVKTPAKTANRAPHNVRAFILPSYLGSVSREYSPSPFLLHSSKTRSFPRHAAKLCEGVEIWYAVHSSGLVGGDIELLLSSVRTAAAHVAVGLTGQHHRHSGVVRRRRPQARYRASRFQGLYHLSSARAELLDHFRRHQDGCFGVFITSSRSSAAAPFRCSRRRRHAVRRLHRQRRTCHHATSHASPRQAFAPPRHALWRGTSSSQA